MFCTDELSLSIFETLRFGLFSANVPVLVYYSHMTAIVVSLFLSFFIFINNRKFLPARILLSISILFSALSIIDIALWTQIHSAVLMYLWSFWLPLFMAIFFLSFYFLYSLVKEKDVSLGVKVSSLIILLGTFFLSFTSFNLEGFDVYNCSAVEGYLMINGVFSLSLIVFVAALVFGIREVRKIDKKENPNKRKKALFATVGVLSFLSMFSAATYYASIANMLGSEPDIFKFEQYGYFGMTIFSAFLTYITVQYKAFNVRLIAAQALVAALIILIGSQFFFIRNPINQALNAITLALALGFGSLLVKSVKKEIEAKELIERQKDQLEKANIRLKELDIQKSEFVSFATHQIRSPLASMKGYASLLLEGDAGVLTDQMRKVVETILVSTKTLSSVVEDYLNISRIELGTMKYDTKDIDFGKLVAEVLNEQKPNIDAKGLSFSVSVDQAQAYPIKADLDKFKQVLMNIVDNSVKYTPKGSLAVSLERDTTRGVIRFMVSDTGVGIAPDVMPKLFRKFSRANNASEANIHGTGLGLYIAKEIVTAHGGKMWAESEGEGKGSRFIVEMGEVR